MAEKNPWEQNLQVESKSTESKMPWEQGFEADEADLKKKEQSDKESISLLTTSNPSVSVAPSTSNGKAIVTPSGGADKFKEHLKNTFDGITSERQYLQHNKASNAYIDELGRQGYSQADIADIKHYKDNIAATLQEKKALKAQIEGVNIPKPNVPEYAPPEIKQQAEREYAQAKESAANDREAYYKLGQLETQTDPTIAINYLTKALSLPAKPQQQVSQDDPYVTKSVGEADILYGIADAKHRLHQDDEAAQYYQETINKATPNDVMAVANAKNGLAALQYRNGDVEGAKQLMKESRELKAPQEKLEATAKEFKEQRKKEEEYNPNTLADGLTEALVLGKGPLGFMNPFAYAIRNVAEPVIETTKSGIEDISNYEDILQREGPVSANLSALGGVAKIGLGAIMAVNPVATIGFTAGANAAGATFPELAQWAMQPISKTLDFTNIDANTGQRALASMGDVILQGLLIHKFSGALKPKADELIKKIENKEQLNIEDGATLQEIGKEITPQELNEAAAKVNSPSDKLIDPELQKLTIKQDQLQQAHDALPEGEAKQAVAQQIPETQKSIEERGQAIINEHQANAVDAAAQVETQQRILNLQNDLTAIPEENKAGRKIVEEQIGELNKQLKPQENASIQIKSTGEIPVQPEAGSSEGVRSEDAGFQESTGEGEVKKEKVVPEENKEEVIPPKTPAEKIQSELPDGKKLRALEKRAINSQTLSADIKSGIVERGVGYIPEGLEISKSNAKELIDIYDATDNLPELNAKVVDTNNKITPGTRAAIAIKLSDVYEKKAIAAKEAGDMKEYELYKNKYSDIFSFAAKKATEGGQFSNAAGKLLKEMHANHPEMVIEELKKKLKIERDKEFEGKENDLKKIKDIIDEFTKSEGFEKIVSEQVKKELAKKENQTTKAKKENIFNSQKIRNQREKELIAKLKKGGSQLSSSALGLSSEQIEQLGELGAIKLINGAVRFAKWAKEMKKVVGDFTDEQLEYIWRSAKLSKELDEQQRSLSEFSQGRFKDMSTEERKSILDSLSDKISGMSEKKKSEFLADIVDEIEKLGGLSDERFKELYAKAMGLPILTEKAQQHIHELSKKISEVDKIADEFQRAHDNGVKLSDLKEISKRFNKAQEDAKYANDELSKYFKKDTETGDLISSLIQSGVMSFSTLIGNPLANLSKALVIAPAQRAISSIGDAILSRAAKLGAIKKIMGESAPLERRTIKAVPYWRGAVENLFPGLKQSIMETVKGSVAEDFSKRDTFSKIEPINAWKRVIDQFNNIKGVEDIQNVKKAKLLNDVIEGTAGINASAVFRILNLGDKVFTLPAEAGYRSEMASILNLNGIAREKFMTMPPLEFQEVLDGRSKEYTFQQEGPAAKVALKFKRLITESNENMPKWWNNTKKILANVILPFVKTPVNVIGTSAQLAIPELAFARAIFEGSRGNRRESLEAFGLGIVGWQTRALFQHAASNGLITQTINDEDTPSEKAAKLGTLDASKAGSINLSGFTRMIMGDDVTTQDDDNWVSYKYIFGLFGVSMNLAAKTLEKHRKDEGTGIDNLKDWKDELAADFATLPKTILESTFLSGLNQTFNAITSPSDFEKMAVNAMGSAASAIIPNTLGSLSRYSYEYQKIPLVKGQILKSFINNVKIKTFNGEKLPNRVNLWGGEIPTLPNDADPDLRYFYACVDGAKIDKVNPHSFDYKMQQTYNELPDNLQNKFYPSPPKGKMKIDGKSIDLNGIAYHDLATYIGKKRKDKVEKYVLSHNYADDSAEEKIRKLRGFYKEGMTKGRELFLHNNPNVEDIQMESDE